MKGICRVGVLHSPNNKITLRGKVDMAVALRFDFDNVLYEAAIDSGATQFSQRRVTGISRNGNAISLKMKICI